jgi:hypothetical protein
MIIKGHARGRFQQLAAHLLKTKENERVNLYESRGTLSQSVEGALAEMEAQGAHGRSKKPLYHASISPALDRPLNEAQLLTAVNLLEAKLGLSGQPRIVVTHRKHGREHAHVVWSRIDRSGKAISDGWNYALHEEAARELEQMFGHDAVQGAHRRGTDAPRPNRTPKEYELRQEARSGLTLKAIRKEISAAWQGSASGEVFQQQIEAAGYRLVRGDRRGFVILDRAGEAHSLARCLGLKTTDVVEKLKAIDLQGLPDVGEGRASQRHTPRRLAGHRVMVRSFTVSAGPISRGIFVSSTHAANRAAIVSDFASKISAAYTDDGTRDEIAARVRRLRDEQAAALAALKNTAVDSRSSVRMRFRSAAREVAGLRPIRRLANQASSAIKPS